VITADNITDEQARVLAKIRVAEHLSHRREGRIARALSDLSYGQYSRESYDWASANGLSDWDNGSILTDAGNRLLDEILNARNGASK
jgi:hypothetical protein